jgi:hypothetical protein
MTCGGPKRAGTCSDLVKQTVLIAPVVSCGVKQADTVTKQSVYGTVPTAC